MEMHRKTNERFDVVVIGGGAGGTSVAARLRRLAPRLRIAVIEPSAFHYYQPAWTLVGGGQYDIERTRRNTQDCLPRGVEWIRENVQRVEPDANAIMLGDGSRIAYRYLVVAAGIALDWDAIEGLAATLGKNGVTSNYRFDLAPYTWQCVREFRGGDALFTQPPMPIKCAGAPQKILYLAADHFARRGVRANISFFTPGPSMFGVPFFAKALAQVMKRYDAQPCYGHRLVRIDGPAKLATFEVTTQDGSKETSTRRFDMIHVVPPQSAPAFIRQSGLGDAGGWLDVDDATLQHVRHPEIFGIGDCTSTPNSKTAAAVKNQVPVVTANLLREINGKGEVVEYDGYASCPLTTSSRRVMLAEFRYGGQITPSFPADPRKPSPFYWWLKQRFLPFLYWDIVIRGRKWPVLHRPRKYGDALPDIQP